MKKSYHSSAEPIAEAIATRVRLVCSRAAKFACMLACGIGFLPSGDRLSTCRRDPTPRLQRAARTERGESRRPTLTNLPTGPATRLRERAERNVDGGRCASNKFGTYRQFTNRAELALLIGFGRCKASFFTRRVPLPFEMVMRCIHSA